MEKIRVAIVGYGNIGRYALRAVEMASDEVCAGIVRRGGSAGGYRELDRYAVVSDIRQLENVDVAIVAAPSRHVGEVVKTCLEAGVSTVDSFDIHTGIAALRTELDEVARRNGVASVVSAGWDPGSDSVVRALLAALAPEGETFTNFGPGRSMGHTVAAKAVPGVRDAVSITVPEGKGVHRREVYVVLDDGAEGDKVAAAIKADPYFASDHTEVRVVDDIAAFDTESHGVNLVREGAAGYRFSFDMRINNPALTGQILACAARAATRQRPGCYTLIEIPPVDLLPGDREDIIRKLV